VFIAGGADARRALAAARQRVARGFVRRIGARPKGEFVQHQHGDSRQVRQLNGTSVPSGVMNKLPRTMTVLCELPWEPLTSRKPLAPAPTL
jgi:hypothetical protein